MDLKEEIVPFVPADDPGLVISVRLNKQDAKRLIEVAEANDLRLSQLAKEAILRFIFPNHDFIRKIIIS